MRGTLVLGISPKAATRGVFRGWAKGYYPIFEANSPPPLYMYKMFGKNIRKMEGKGEKSIF